MPRSTALNVSLIGGAQLFAVLFIQAIIIVLAHFVSPSDFGIFAVFQVIINLSISLSGFGLEEAAIQTKKDPESAIATGATLRLVFALIAGAIILLLAPVITAFFSIEKATFALRVVCISFVLQGLAFVPRVWMKKELKFGQLALSTVVNTLLWSAVALALGIAGASYWALIAALVIGTLGSCATLWILRPGKIQFRLKKDEARDLLRFGGYVMATSLVLFLLLNLDKVAVGRLLGSDQLGVYWVTFQYGAQPLIFLASLMTYVIYPEYVNLSHDVTRLREKHRRMLRFLALAAFPLGVGIASVSPSFVISLLGHRWENAVVPLSILGIFGIMFSINMVASVVFMATDNTRGMFRLNLVMFAPFVILLVPSIQAWGLEGVASLFVAVAVVQFLWIARSVGGMLSYSPSADIREVYIVPLVASVAAGGTMLSVWLVLGTSIITLVLQIAVGFLLYFLIVMMATKGAIIGEVKGMLHNILRKSQT